MELGVDNRQVALSGRREPPRTTGARQFHRLTSDKQLDTDAWMLYQDGGDAAALP